MLLICYLGEGYWLAGEYDKARQTLEKGLEIMERCGAKFYAGFAQRLMGEIAMKTNPSQVGEPLAAPHFEKSITIFKKSKPKTSWRWPTHAMVGFTSEKVKSPRYGSIYRRP